MLTHQKYLDGLFFEISSETSMVTPVTSRTVPLIEGSPFLELPIATENVASGVNNEPTTQSSASSSSVTKTSRGKGFLGNLRIHLSRRKSVLRKTKQAWDDVIPSSHNITSAESLLAFNALVINVNKARDQSSGNKPTTQSSASPSVTKTSGGKGFLGNLRIHLSRRKSVLRKTKQAWDDVVPSSHNITSAESLLAFNALVINVNKARDQSSEEVSLVAEAQLRMAYNLLSHPIKKQLDVWIQGPNELESEIDIVAANKGMNISKILTTMYDQLPSVLLDYYQKMLSTMDANAQKEGVILNRRLSTMDANAQKAGVILRLLRVNTSPLDPDVTEEILNQSVLSALDTCSVPFRKIFYNMVQSYVLDYEKDSLQKINSQFYLEINGVMISTANPNFASLIVETEPRAERVRYVIFVMEHTKSKEGLRRSGVLKQNGLKQ